MGFMKSMFGGSDSKSTNSSESGFSLLPEEIQGAYNQYATATSDMLPTAGAAFTPIGTTPDEEAAYSAIRGGFAPTEASIGSDIAMQMNPFDTNVIDEINRQAGGEYSVLKGVFDEAGAFGSNREMLGANDIDLTRLNQIGQFKQDQYNSALDNALTTMPGARSQDASNLLSIGDKERGLAMQTSQADMQGLLALGQAMGALPQSGGSTSTGYSMTDTSTGIIPAMGGGQGAAKAATGIANASDERLKEDIKLVSVENGHNIYEFKYKGKPEKYRGVMAQEVQKINPEAVVERDGFLAVYYDKIGVDFRRIA